MVTLEVTDNGKGITSERMTTPQSFGLRGMQERASLLGGHFHIVGTSGVGTTASPPCRLRSASPHDWDTAGENSRHRRSRGRAPGRETDP